MDPHFLRNVQKAGWQIMSADTISATVACPRAGCSLKVRLKDGAKIPQACIAAPDLSEVTITTYNDARVFLHGRRVSLGLTIKELEEVAGVTVDHLAKAEKSNPSRHPNMEIMIEWATALGYEIVLRPAQMPSMALRYIADSRPQAAARLRMQAHHRSRRNDEEQPATE